MSNKKITKVETPNVRIEKQGRKEFVVKALSAEERHNELFFYRELKRAKLSQLEAFEQDGELWVEYKKNATTLGSKESVKAYEQFGAFMRAIHAIHFLTPLLIDSKGTEKPMVWSKVMDLSLKEAARRKGFNATVTKKALKVIEASGIRTYTGQASLLHCDTHQNNVLIDDKVLLIDKGSLAAAGDPLYDLAMLAIVLPGSIYLNKKKDREYLKAFIKGYGSDFIADRKRFDAYVLLRCLDRWPNAFEKEIPEIVKKILSI